MKTPPVEEQVEEFQNKIFYIECLIRETWVAKDADEAVDKMKSVVKQALLTAEKRKEEYVLRYMRVFLIKWSENPDFKKMIDIVDKRIEKVTNITKES